MIFSIQKMPLPASDYFRYFAPSADLATWGIGVTAAGRTQVPAGSPYPPLRHPADHDFTWEHGRILEALQIVLIGAGAGTFEMRGTPARSVQAGSAFVVLPRVWHRYRPDPATGWNESWIEVQGPAVDRLIRAQVFSGNSVLRSGAAAAGLETALEGVHAIARHAGPGFDPELSARALAVVAAWRRMGDDQAEQPHVRAAVTSAERYLADHFAEDINMRALARRLGVAYSHFRREFKRHTGFAPWQYVIQLRLSRARRLLVSSHATLDDLSHRLGFSSAFHLSAAFKRAYGVSPSAWRRAMRSRSDRM